MNLIINFTPTGMIPTKEMTPHVPISVEEIIEDVRVASQIGISMVHLHAREASNGEPTHQPELYGEIIEGIRAFDQELVICVSLSGRNVKTFEARSAPLQLLGEQKPDMGSLTLSSLNFNKVESVNSPSMIQALANEMLEKGILPELEVFDIGMINYSKYLIRKGLLKAPHYFNLLFGNIACSQADLTMAGLMVRDLPEGSFWSFAGIGDAQLMMNSVGVASGYGVRVGLEDNIWYDDKRNKLATNADLLRRVHVVAEANNRSVMTALELRGHLNLQPGRGFYGRATST
ncbi:MAG: 3-keto-5-aminohexanoate cleavage protein [Verrucomicrobiota bacterium]